ncbi:hypothetical protein JKY72_04900 [Candidatus Gracilibacteria bacterium]|nr:hypothetical protein [Candidatus Gracilibacteria bacterium]
MEVSGGKIAGILEHFGYISPFDERVIDAQSPPEFDHYPEGTTLRGIRLNRNEFLRDTINVLVYEPGADKTQRVIVELCKDVYLSLNKV